MQKLYADINKSIKKYRLYVLRDVFIFMVITLVVHFAYRYWANTLHYFPVENTMNQSHEKMAQLVFNQSVWLIDNVLNIPISTGPDRFIYFKNDGFIAINHSCSGLKPMLQFILLMLIFPGPWKHKAWFIPMGMLIVHCTNLFRICGLAVVTITVPEYWDFAHDNVFRPFFYVVIFFLWVWWVERYKPQASSLKPQA
jgi:exosortase/archaeosortase family protein